MIREPEKDRPGWRKIEVLQFMGCIALNARNKRNIDDIGNNH